MYRFFAAFLLVSFTYAIDDNSITDPSLITTTALTDPSLIKTTELPANSTTETPLTVCSCGVFLSGQLQKGNKPSGNPALLHEQFETFPCTSAGNKMCVNKCLDTIVKHLPNSPNILCGSIDRDCYKERAHLFIRNCKDDWISTNLSAGREYCCKDGLPYKCMS